MVGMYLQNANPWREGIIIGRQFENYNDFVAYVFVIRMNSDTTVKEIIVEREIE